ncbi:MAG: hypothetical protein GYA85_06245 [Propionibacterium sp.]|nr:hypothetical protein [Propionibacterium sp.]
MSLPVMNAAPFGHQQFADRADLVRDAGASGGAEFEHPPVAGAVGAVEFVAGEWGDDDPGADRVDRTR